MKTDSEIISIHLERDTEDIQLEGELNKAFPLLGKGIKEVATNFPLLFKLKEKLGVEIRRTWT